MNWLLLIVIIWIIGAIMIAVEKISARIKISAKMNSNPESALQAAKKSLESKALTLDEYESQLIKIAESTGYAGAMLQLADFYTGEDNKGKKDEAKRKFWKERAVKAGDLKSITDYYGFSDYDVSSTAYNEMIRDLDTAGVTAASEEQKAVAIYLKGVANYKLGKIDAAKQLFVSLSQAQLANESTYMLFRCFVKEMNISAAERVLKALQANKFEISAADYLNLYNYYAAKRNGADADYAAEARYVEQYAASKDADHETANRIGGDTYYTIAIAFQNGSNGFEQNTEKALEAYEKAASFENEEALYYLGKNYWIGKDIRNYHRANEYLLKAGQKGHEQANEILELYGVDGILVKPMQAEKISYQFLGGYELTALGNTIQWLQLFYGIQYKETLIATAFSDTYTKTFQSFEQLINGIHQLYADHVAQMLRWGLQLLMSFGIDMYDAADILDECEDLSLLPRVPKFEQGLERIDDRAAQLKTQTAYAQAARGQWSGAGFGTTIGSTIKATVKASAAAGVMNIGSGILHGIGDSIVKAMDNSEIKSMEKRLFENPDTGREFCNALITACVSIADVVMEMIEKHSNIGLKNLEGKVMFGDESLAEIDDRILNAKINNNLSAQKWVYTYALLVEKLRRAPLDADVFQLIITLTIRQNKTFTGKEYESILRYAGDFRMDTQNLAAALEKITVGA